MCRVISPGTCGTAWSACQPRSPCQMFCQTQSGIGPAYCGLGGPGRGPAPPPKTASEPKEAGMMGPGSPVPFASDTAELCDPIGLNHAGSAAGGAFGNSVGPDIAHGATERSGWS